MLTITRKAPTALLALTGSVVGGIILGIAVVIGIAITVALVQLVGMFAGEFITASLPGTITVLAIAAGLYLTGKLRSNTAS